MDIICTNIYIRYYIYNRELKKNCCKDLTVGDILGAHIYEEIGV